ncbi:phage gp6-like head-tail connector protein [Cereibacter sphaeroides]|uniref:Phage gp6-like head-tail connector protein n=1 Tax=Cereibacter sphaeroides TaxID=1063 RepID=A0AAX1US43_CERSP|nr:head-tail connector protein [Cereibacter sphaeroides]RHZ98858.1 phage gp6-like head-tail connector protein [Cereibacter sphaeroides]
MLKQITPPTELPVPLAEAKARLRIDHNEDDAILETYIRAATERLDGPNGYLGRAITPQVWEITLDRFTGPIRLPLPPCREVTSVAYVAADGSTVTLDPAAYIVAGLGSDEGAVIHPATGWPATATHPEAVTVRFSCGYTTVPEPIRMAILERLSQSYDGDEEDLVPGREEDLTRNLRVWSFG